MAENVQVKVVTQNSSLGGKQTKNLNFQNGVLCVFSNNYFHFTIFFDCFVFMFSPHYFYQFSLCAKKLLIRFITPTAGVEIRNFYEIGFLNASEARSKQLGYCDAVSPQAGRTL